MRTKWLVYVVLAVFFAAAATPLAASDRDRIVRTTSADGLPVIGAVCQLLGCTVLGSLDILPGETAPSSLFLVRGLVDTVVTLLLSLLGLASIETDLPVSVEQSPTASAAVMD